MKKKGFTLIELIAILVILAILVLIAVPLIVSIIKSTKNTANKRSIDLYGKAAELAASEYQMDTGAKANNFDQLNIKYSGNKVECNKKLVYQNSVFLSECMVNGVMIKDSKTSDGYYHYGDIFYYSKIYEKAVNKAINNYIKLNNKAPESFSSLKLNIDNLDFSCDVSRIYSDGSIFLKKCKLLDIYLMTNGGKDFYSVGENRFFVGDEVRYKGVEFYVIADSTDDDETLKIMKKDPLKYSEVDGLVGQTELISKLNADSNGYLNMPFFMSDSCDSAGPRATGCTNDYEFSDIKQVVDVWGNEKFGSNSNIKFRILEMSDLVDNLGYEFHEPTSPTAHSFITKSENTPEWMDNFNKMYWTMTAYDDLSTVYGITYSSVSVVNTSNSGVNYYGVYKLDGMVRPVLVMPKDELSD